MKNTLKLTVHRTLRWFAFAAACVSALAIVAALAGKYPQRLAPAQPPVGHYYAGPVDMHSVFNFR